MKISDVMSTGVASVSPSDSLQSAAAKMNEINVGSLPVTDGGRLMGVVTDRDIAIRAVAEGKGPESTVETAMTPGCVTCGPDTDVTEAAGLMRDKQIRRIYVVDGDQLAGVASLGDLALEERAEESGETLREISKP
jgi:CBS domain-containing protein